jgi:hypothetical protein
MHVDRTASPISTSNVRVHTRFDTSYAYDSGIFNLLKMMFDGKTTDHHCRDEDHPSRHFVDRLAGPVSSSPAKDRPPHNEV